MLTLQIRRASEGDLRLAAELFDGYRQFYGQLTDYSLAEAFLRDRFANNDSVVLVATETQSGEGLGFVQLYPSLSSVAARRSLDSQRLVCDSGGEAQGVQSRF